MNMSCIVRRGEDLKAVGAEVLRAAFSIELVRRVLDGLEQRKRLYDGVTTWLIFLGQTLSPDHSCRAAVACARIAGVLSRKASVHTGAYCQARDRLPEDTLHTLASGLGQELMQTERPAERWHGRRVLVPDGSSVSLPDTWANQAAYPQSHTQAAGCGFPVLYLCTLMSLASGALLDFATGCGNGNELTLWRRLWHWLRRGDVVLGDGKYAAYADVALLSASGIDVVARPGKRKVDFRRGTALCAQDHLVIWERPALLPAWLKAQVLPTTMLMRELRFLIHVPGFRPASVTLVTTLVDSDAYTKEDLAELFFCRWQVEVRLRDIKTMLGMDMLRTKTPERARKELWMYLAALNLLRTLMRAAAQQAGAALSRVSFQGCRQRLLAAVARPCPASRFNRLYRQLIGDMAQDLHPHRPYRFEPRAIKRRKKQYDLLNQPRAILRQRLRGAA